MTNAPTTTDYTCCLDEDCTARTSQGWMTCESRRLNEDFIYEDALRSLRLYRDIGIIRATEVFNDPTDIAFYQASVDRNRRVLPAR